MRLEPGQAIEQQLEGEGKRSLVVRPGRGEVMLDVGRDARVRLRRQLRRERTPERLEILAAPEVHAQSGQARGKVVITIA